MHVKLCNYSPICTLEPQNRPVLSLVMRGQCKLLELTDTIFSHCSQESFHSVWHSGDVSSGGCSLPLLSMVSAARRASLPPISKATGLVLADLSSVVSPSVNTHPCGKLWVLQELHSLAQEKLLEWGPLSVTWVMQHWSHYTHHPGLLLLEMCPL